MTVQTTGTQHAHSIASRILAGFHQHFRRFQAITDEASQLFLKQDWPGLQELARDRISFYDARVTQTVHELEAEQLASEPEETLWHEVRGQYEAMLAFHPQAELAETFYNSVFCKLFHRRYFYNRFIFVESTLARRIPLAVETEYRAYFPVATGVRETLYQIVADMQFGGDFAHLDRDIKALMQVFRQREDLGQLAAWEMRIDVLLSPFYRNKAAYVVGRIVTREHQVPFIVPVLVQPDGRLYLDALITNTQQMAIIFSFARAYFLVHTLAPSALVRFLQGLMPHKTLAELYSATGLHKQGKTEFYRELLTHLKRSEDQLVEAPGIRGQVMLVFTLPSFPYVFKIIKDKFGPGKPFGPATVKQRYHLVKQHDRVGRMADTLEYSEVALPRSRFSPDLLAQLEQHVAGSMEFEDNLIIFRHLYIEKRLEPLNLYLPEASVAEQEEVIKDYGQALKDMIAANIFPGDMLLKNFGLTRNGRVVFYDYDEVQYLTDMYFRDLPAVAGTSDYLADEPVTGSAPNDVYPEQIAQFVLTRPLWREALRQHHPELLSAAYWRRQQERIRAGEVADVYPYPTAVRFRHTRDKVANNHTI